MDQSAVKAIVDREIEPLARALGIPHWHLTVTYGPIDGADEGCLAAGKCDRLLDYETATITIDPYAVDDEDHLLRVLRHELFHVVLSPFDLLRAWVLTGPGGDEYERVLRMANHATEVGVKNLERLWRCVADHHKPKRPDKAEPKPMAKARPRKGR